MNVAGHEVEPRETHRGLATRTTPSVLRVLAFAGSLRRASYNRLLLETAAANAPSSLAIRIHDLGAVPLFNEDHEAAGGAGPEAVEQLRCEVRLSDALLVATPEYNQAIPGVLKNTIDWLSRPAPDEVLIGKPVAIIGATAGRWGTRLAQSQLRQVLYATESLVLPGPNLYIRDAAQLFDASGRLTDGATLESLRSVLEALASWTARVARRR